MWNYGSNSASNPMMWMGMAFGLVFLFIFLALSIWMIVAFSRRNAADSPVPPSSRAIELLKERYARGEISTEEFRERLLELEGDKRA